MDSGFSAPYAANQKAAFLGRTLQAWNESALSGSEYERQNNLTKNSIL